jgi:hypothetical protein
LVARAGPCGSPKRDLSNASGTTQFIQLVCQNDNHEDLLGSFTITASGNTFKFVTNLPDSNTANKWVLIATSNFATLPGGVTPDYQIPANFFSTGLGSMTYASVIDTWNYGAVPTDGIHSLKRDGTTMVNSAINHAGATGSVNLASAVPAIPSTAIVVLLGVVLLAASGLLRKQARSQA